MVDIPKVISGSKHKSELRHVAVNTGEVKEWAEDNKKEFSQAVKKHLSLLDELIDLQLKHQNRVLTINLSEHEGMLEDLKEFFNHLINDERIHENQMRVFIIGQWYELDSELSDIFKELMEKTHDYDNFFLSFCINYDGQEEMLGAIRLIVRKILAEKLKEEDLSKEIVKENIYTSYFPPAQLIIETDWKYSGLLLWDSKGAIIYYTRKPWMQFEKKNFERAVKFYNKEIEKEEEK